MKLKVYLKKYRLIDGAEKKLVRRVGDGSIITRFEKTPLPQGPDDVVCPHFLELKWATGCPFNCSWCYLQGTLRFQPQKKRPRVKDLRKVAAHVESFLEQVDWYSELLNTGELADSLMWDNNGNPFSKFILSLFKDQKRHKVLFLSKATWVDNLVKLKATEHAIASFSLNADKVARRWEKGAPLVLKRIKAAKKLSEAGYEVRIRIDPIVPVYKWEEEYKKLIDLIFENFTPERITLGSLRGLQSTINNSHDKTWVQYLSENSNWGKRIDSNARYWMFFTLINYLKENYNYSSIALCKETVSIWEKLGLDYKKIKCNCLL
jgi:spore photoproduct lyase